MDEKDLKKPGQPRKPKIIGKTTLRFRANYPYLKEELMQLKKKTRFTTLNDFILEILNKHVNTEVPHDAKRLEKLEIDFKKFIQNINTEINNYSLKLKTTFPHPTESIDFKELVSNLFPIPDERTIFYLKFIQSLFHTEFTLLNFLLTFSPVEFDTLPVKNYLDYYIEENNLKEENRTEVQGKLSEDFLNAWVLKLFLNNIIKDKKKFEVNIDSLEAFIFNNIYPELKSTPFFNKKDFKILQSEWKIIVKNLMNALKDLNYGEIEPLNIHDIHDCLDFNLINVQKIQKILKSLLNKCRHDASFYFPKKILKEAFERFMKKWIQELGLRLRNKFIEKIRNDLKNIIFNEKEDIFQNIEEFDFRPSLIANLKLFTSLSEQVDSIEGKFKKNIPKYVPDFKIGEPSLNKEDFLNNIYSYFDFFLKDYHNEYNISFIMPFYEIYFSPFIINKILDLESYYEYLKKKKVIIDFFHKKLKP